MAEAALTSNKVLTIGVSVGIGVGLGAYAAGLSEVAAISWAATSFVALVFLTFTVVGALCRGKIGLDIIALIAIAGALLLGQYLAGAIVALMLSGGQSLEDFAQARARRELSSLLARAPRTVNRYERGTAVSVPIESVRRGDLLLVKPGEVLPVDGIVTDTAILDESALTGESKPVKHERGDRVQSGTVNAARRPFDLRATTTAAESTYAGIIRLVAEAQSSKAPLTRLADRYALFFLPVTLAVAAGAWAISGDPVRGLAVLVIATPCPLILAAPVAIVAGISRAARRGVIVKGGGALETLARASVLVLDKTGTVTAGSPVITNIETYSRFEPDEILRLAASLDQMSPHVLAPPILRAASDRGLEISAPTDVVEDFGSGIRGRVNGHEVALGKIDWLLQGAPAPQWLARVRRRMLLEGSSSVAVAIDGEIAGAIVLEDPIRSGARSMIRSLRREGFRTIHMLTGDHPDVANAVGAIIGVDRVFSDCSPAEKVDAVKAARGRGITVMVGDGINDAPALAAADVGVAMGARGATAASEAADVVLLVDRVDSLIDARRIAHRSRFIAVQSIVAGMGMSFVGMGFAAAGLLVPVAGAILQELIDVIVILNALRALGTRGRRRLKAGIRPGMSAQIRSEHERLLPGIKRIRSLADRLDFLTVKELRVELQSVYHFLVQELLPHERAEDAHVYPIVSELIGGEDPTATMSRTHVEIAHLVNALGRYLEDLASEHPTRYEMSDLRRILYGLDAILRLHFAQEDESYVSLIDSELEAQSPEMRKAA